MLYLPSVNCHQSIARSQFSENDQFNVFDRKAESSLSSFKILSEADVTKIIKASKNKTCDLDPVPTDIVKTCLIELVTPITSIINKSLATGFMPSVLKEAVVTPLIKKPNEPLEYKNFRPVSNLSYLSKLIEKAVANETRVYIQENSYGEPLQSAYKLFNSTETALIYVVNYILLELDKQNLVLMALLDLSAAFDTVAHHILLTRLEQSFGITGNAIQWFKSYLD